MVKQFFVVLTPAAERPTRFMTDFGEFQRIGRVPTIVALGSNLGRPCRSDAWVGDIRG